MNIDVTWGMADLIYKLRSTNRVIVVRTKAESAWLDVRTSQTRIGWDLFKTLLKAKLVEPDHIYRGNIHIHSYQLSDIGKSIVLMPLEFYENRSDETG
jgi:hypothetical protein